MRRAGPRAARNAGTGATPVIARGEALRRGERLDLAHDRADGNVCGACQADAAAFAAHRFHVAAPCQAVHDLHQVVLGNSVRSCDVADGRLLIGVPRQEHEDAQRVVGKSCELHRGPPLARQSHLLRSFGWLSIMGAHERAGRTYKSHSDLAEDAANMLLMDHDRSLLSMGSCALLPVTPATRPARPAERT